MNSNFTSLASSRFVLKSVAAIGFAAAGIAVIVFASVGFASTALAAGSPVFDQLAGKGPLAGSFGAGEQLLRSANPVAEAGAVFLREGAQSVVVCAFACTSPGGEKLKKRGPKIPGTSDAITAANKGYNEAAQNYALRFNSEMVLLASGAHVATPPSAPNPSNGSTAASAPTPDASLDATLARSNGLTMPPEPAGTSGSNTVKTQSANGEVVTTTTTTTVVTTATTGEGSSRKAGPAPRALSDSELSMNGVIVGKSNLYNSVGKFGTNMFHKVNDKSFVCWKGVDGTTLAYESDTQAGGPDQTITAAHLLASGVPYAYAKDCKASKKVSAALSIAGLRLGESISRAAEQRGGQAGDQKLSYSFSTTGKRKKRVHFTIELNAKEDKITDILVGKTETN